MRKLITSAIILAASIGSTANAENIFLYKDGKVIFTENTENIGRLAYEDSNSAVAIYDSEGKQLFKALLSEIDYLSNKHEAPVADLLDVVFNESGTASDVSPMKMKVRANNNGGISTYFNKDFGRYAASFDNAWGSTVKGSYRIDYGTNTEFRNALADGHTLEVVVMANFDGELSAATNNKESKCFASHQAGGTGIMICTQNRGTNGKNEFTFLPDVENSYRWATAGFEPEKGTFYHIVGVWDKVEGKAKIYVNGELKKSVAASGTYTEPSTNSRWFCIGGDASNSDPSNGWKGDVVIARVYDDALTEYQVKGLWTDVEAGCSIKNDMIVTDATLYNLPVMVNKYYPIRGKQFVEGDSFVFENNDNEYYIASEILENEARVIIPSDFVSGKYNVYLNRGEQRQRLGRVSLNVVATMSESADVIAHRGYWNRSGAAQNSRASLKYAQEIEAYGSETDIWLTTDNKIYINHDPSFSGVTIEKATSEQCAKLKLSNGEYMPTLEDFLTIIKESTSRTKLIIEIKGHSSAQRNRECGAAAVKAVREAGVEDKVEYISFSADALAGVLEADPDAFCAYLGSNLTPKQCFEKGHKGVDFSFATYKSNKTYFKQAHDLGMLVNAWTISAASDIIEAMNYDIDFITSDEPEDVQYIKEYYDNHR